MSKRRNPLYWRVGKGKWHEETLLAGTPTRPMTDSEFRVLLRGDYPLRSLCYQRHSKTGKRTTHTDIQTRRSAPPVADQCARCRAAKAKAKEAKT